MKDFIKREWLYLLVIAGLAVLTFMQVSTFRFGFFTAYDEAYFLLKLQEAYDMSCITGKSQWNLIAIHWFPYMDLTSKANSYLAANILVWLSVIIVAGTLCKLYDKQRFLKYFAMTWLFMFGGGGLYYVPMQVFVFSVALSAFLLFKQAYIEWKKYLLAVICGLFLGIGLFIYILAAAALLGCIAVLIVILYHNYWKKTALYLLCGLGGVCVAIAYVHFCVCDLGRIVEAMRFTSSYITKSGYNYGGISFALQYSMFFRDCIFVVLAFVGAYWLSLKIKNKYLGTLLYVVLVLVYAHYQVKPDVSSSMIMLSLPLIPLFFSGKEFFSWQVLKQKQTWFYLFLLAFPLLASLGTNTSLGGRIQAFVFAWLFLWFGWENKLPEGNYKRVVIAVALLFAFPLMNVAKTYINKDDSFHFTRGNKHFSEIALQKCQKDYFDRVYDILEDYNFQPKKSVVFTACFDYCCLYAFDAENSSNFYQIQNFHYFDKSKMLKPDFVFLSRWDSIVVAKELSEMPWGWPEEFDRYYVGTPEPDNASWSIHPELETRYLYCRKAIKKE